MALNSLFVMNQTLDRSFRKSKKEANTLQRNVGINMASFCADSILWATSYLYEKYRDTFDEERLVSFDRNLGVFRRNFFNAKFFVENRGFPLELGFFVGSLKCFSLEKKRVFRRK